MSKKQKKPKKKRVVRFDVPSQSEQVAVELPVLDDGLTGWKRAALTVTPTGPMFHGVAHNVSYAATDTAVCNHNAPPAISASGVSYYWSPTWPGMFSVASPHDVPHKDCACGFYAARDRNKLPELAGEYARSVCDLEVELSGHYLQYQHGYRAEKQQVVSVRVDSGCRACSGTASVLFVASGLLMPLCETCAAAERSRQFTAFARGAIGTTAPPVVWRFTLAELAAELGVHDVRWADRAALQKGN